MIWKQLVKLFKKPLTLIMCGLLALMSFGIGMIRLHQMVPLLPDYAGYAPTLAPPLSPQIPDVGTSVGCLAPNFTLLNLEGQEVSLSDYRGSLVILNFWTYCSACKQELPYIQSAYDTRGSLAPGLVVLAVNVTQQVDQVKEFVDYYGYTFDFLLDMWATVASEYYLRQIPTTFFIDKNGIIEDIQVGAFSGATTILQRITKLANQ